MDKITFQIFVFLMASSFIVGVATLYGTIDFFFVACTLAMVAILSYAFSHFLEIAFPTIFFDDRELEKHIPSPLSHVRIASSMSLAEPTLDEDEAERRRIAEDLADFDRRLRSGGA